MSSIAAIALIRDEHRRVLLVKQTGGPFVGSWLLPGGRIENDESAVHAAVREVREETGLTMTTRRTSPRIGRSETDTTSRCSCMRVLR